jgi:hypothetical protein
MTQIIRYPVCLLAVATAAVSWIPIARGVPITVYEEIVDIRTGGNITNPSDVALQRNRLNPDGTITTVTDDRGSGSLGYVESNGIPGIQNTVRTGNSVSDHFGFTTSTNVTYSHKTDWLGVDTFTGPHCSLRTRVWTKPIRTS